MKHVLPLLPILLTACHNPPPAAVPLRAEAHSSLVALAGSWSGSYVNNDAMRGGSIVFTFTAGEDHAHGDVVMVPNDAPHPMRPLAPLDLHGSSQMTTPPVEVLTIDFVQVERDSIMGTLAAYVDPACGCVTTAVFRGSIEGTVIRGTFIATPETGRAMQGTWEVKRKR